MQPRMAWCMETRPESAEDSMADRRGIGGQDEELSAGHEELRACAKEAFRVRQMLEDVDHQDGVVATGDGDAFVEITRREADARRPERISEARVSVGSVHVRETPGAQPAEQMAGATAQLENRLTLGGQEPSQLAEEQRSLNALEAGDRTAQQRRIVAGEVRAIVDRIALA